MHGQQRDQKPKVLVPFHFTGEKSSLDYLTNLNRYQFLTHLAEFAELETLAFPEEKKEDFQDLDAVRVRNIGVAKESALMPAWYAMDGYDGILLLSQFLTDDLLYYRVPDVPIVHCIDASPAATTRFAESASDAPCVPKSKRYAGCQSLVDEGMDR